MANDLERYNSSLSGPEADAALRDMANHTSERYAKGTVNGSPVGGGQVGYQDNSKYYKERAEEAAERAESAITPGVEGAVLWTAAQSLTDTAKQTARNNIGATATNPNLLINGHFTINQRQGHITKDATVHFYGTPDFQYDGGSIGYQVNVGYYSASAYSFISGGVTYYVKASDVVEGYLTANNTAYTFDCWFVGWGSTISKTNGVITKALGTQILQPMEDDLWNFLVGKTVTCSLMYEDYTVKSLTFVFNVTNGYIGSQPVSSNSNFAGKKGLFFNGNASVPELKFRAIKLELGEVSTLANDVAPNDAIELVRCYPYLQPIGGDSVDWVNASKNLSISAKFPIPMRTTPVLKVFNKTVNCYQGADVVATLSDTITGYRADKNGIDYCTIATTWSDATKVTANSTIRALSNNIILASAEL